MILKINRPLLLILLLITTLSDIKSEIRYHCAADSVKALELIKAAGEGAENYGRRMTLAAEYLAGIPYGSSADNDTLGTIMVRLDSLTQRDFIYASISAAKTAGLTNPTLKDFEKNLENVSRRKGKDEGFASQFFYGADWIQDNIYRGNLKELTTFFETGNFKTKTLDYVSRHADEFPAMANPEVAEKVRITEFGFRSHMIPYLKKQSINNKRVKDELQEGDIIILNSPDADFDIYDIGIVTLQGDEPALIHIQKETGKVVKEDISLSRLFKNEGQFFTGYRLLRVIE